MKFSMYPRAWESTVRELVDAGHEYIESPEDHLPEGIDFLVFNGSGEQCPEFPASLRYVQTCFAGLDGLLDAGKLTDSVRWANAKGLFAPTVAESTVGLILGLYHMHKVVTRAASWSVNERMDAETTWLYDNKTVAIIGAGGIGEELIRLLRPFGPRIIAVTSSGREVDSADESVRIDRATEEGVWARADIVVLLAPLTESTRGMVNAETLRKMKKEAILVNVGRGGLVVTDDLVDALRAGEIAGAALDVTDPEPLPDGHPLWEMEQVLITPHTANTRERMTVLMGGLAVKNAAAFERGETMPTEVDVARGY
ncbi:D-isomer specific 2-hydroxyacid dehydrogenase family protein [Corynebacterium uropygiale]|uniref:D-isomer specific 2-hydroxyacid dehydrogenase family protein n=1 Tax=Corynebacterium uropygiale TaxID=1775911 RepID=A0A9X1QQ23_9CORY|nr:D-isomer specific 2-hydroxyacid dehydrogenase family protein [Corynebacterium uropygiale]MCF4007527.1 D-isomer specific 2-hydroxyacid dehydrogenase family protein [Corynebacterium uropygiale]